MATQKPMAATSGKRKQSNPPQNHSHARKKKLFTKIQDKIEEENDPDNNAVVLHDDIGNGDDSWVDVRKQRIVIIIPALPKASPKKRVRNRKTLSLSSPSSRIQAQKGAEKETLSLKYPMNLRLQARNTNCRFHIQKSSHEDLKTLANPHSRNQGEKSVNQEPLNAANPTVHGQKSLNQESVGHMKLNSRSRHRKDRILDPVSLTNPDSGCGGLKNGTKETLNFTTPIKWRMQRRKTGNLDPLNITNPNSKSRNQEWKNSRGSGSTFSHEEEIHEDGFVPLTHAKDEDRKRGYDKISGTNEIRIDKRKLKSVIGRFSKENTKRRQSNRTMLIDQPISSMDILLASALDAEHGNSVSWQEDEEENEGEQQDHNGLLVKGIEEKISLDTGASGIQRKNISHLQSSSIKIGKALAETGEVCLEATFDEHCTSQVYVNNVEIPLRCIQIPPILTPSQTLRVSMLKKHLDKVGGFGKWLCLVGLNQFKEAFEKRIWSEVELLQLSMDDLKHMGNHAVGPRRKLIWAINHLSQQLI